MDKEGTNMELKRKYLRGTIGHVAKILGVTYAAARVQLNNGVIKAKNIALDYEKQILLNEISEKDALKEKEQEIFEMKKNLGKHAL